MTDESTEIALIDRRIGEITKLAHSNKESESIEYARLQPELTSLVARKLGRGVATQSTAVAAREGAPTDVAQYGPLPDNGVFDAIDSRMWFQSVTGLQKLGISSRQASGLIDLLAHYKEEGQRQRDYDDAQKQATAKRHAQEVLRARHGADWEAKLHAAERALRHASRHDPNARIGKWQLHNGELLGSRVEFVSMLIELGEMAS